MNVRCQSCDTVYRIDPLKVPAEGVHARCTVCSAVIPIERTSEADAPATGRPSLPIQSTEDRVKHALGDAFIPAPHDDDGDGSVRADAGSDMELGQAFADVSEAEREAERTSERQAVESMPGIIMPPTEDRYFDAPDTPPSETVEAPPEVDTESDTVPIEPIAPRVSRPFLPPSDLPFAKPTIEKPVQQVRPTAPVFRPTPGRPAQTPISAPLPPRRPLEPPAAPAAPFSPQVSPPLASPTPSPRPPVTPVAPKPAMPVPPKPAMPVAPKPEPAEPQVPLTRAPINPFLSRDPGQKARRLARALISDMIVYQPEKRQKALEAGTLADAFEEEIKKSWQEYVDQVGEDLANSTTYFNDALNELLADGEKMF